MLSRLLLAAAVAIPVAPLHAVELSPSQCPAPDYPAEAQRYAMSGPVALAFAVDAGGRAQGGRVERSSGYALLDRSALRMLGACRFSGPATAAATMSVPFALPAEARVDSLPSILRETCLRPYKLLSFVDGAAAAHDLSVRVQVWPDGQAFGPKIERSSGEPLADQAALDMVEHCRFRPAARAGEGVRGALLLRLVLQREALGEEALRARYDGIAARIRKQQDFRVRHIELASEDAARAVLGRLRAGEDFARLARDLSQDRASMPIGGELGWLGPGDGPPELAQALARFGKPGLLPSPVKTRFGWHVAEIEEARPRTPPPFNDEARRILREQAIAEREVVVQAPPLPPGSAP